MDAVCCSLAVTITVTLLGHTSRLVKPMPFQHTTCMHGTQLMLLRVYCYAMLCCAVLCYAMLCYAMLCYAMLCYAMLCYAMLCCAMLCCAVLIAGYLSVLLGVLFMAAAAIVLFVFRYQIGPLFVDDARVRQEVAGVAPICAAYQIPDGIYGVSSGVLR